MHDLREPHLAMLKRVLRYVKGTRSTGIHIGTGSITSLTAYSDADWAGCPDKALHFRILRLPRRQLSLLVLQTTDYGLSFECGG
jgi:hypothetical protein